MSPVETYQVRVFYVGVPVIPDVGFLYGPFLSVERAEDCCITLAGRADVKQATVETISPST
jgi:hypothetical protein